MNRILFFLKYDLRPRIRGAWFEARHGRADVLTRYQALKKPKRCCECIHFELCRGMFGNADTLPCDQDDYFEPRD